MITAEQIPYEVVLAALRAYLRASDNDYTTSSHDFAVAIAAALNAWPSGAVCHYRMGDSEGLEMVLPLPFPQEKQDD